MSGTKSFDDYFRDWQELTTGYLAQITSDHSYIHRGWAFTGIGTVNTGSTYRIGFKTPTEASGLFVHWRPITVSSNANAVSVVLTEGDSFSGGTDSTPINRNRTCTRTSAMQAFKVGVTSSPSGTVLQSITIGSTGNPNSRSGGASGADEELLLKADTNYVFTLTPEGSTDMAFTLFWYEEEEYNGR